MACRHDCGNARVFNVAGMSESVEGKEDGRRMCRAWTLEGWGGGQ